MNTRSKVGHYDIVSELGRGGMGVVYKGHEPALGRHVAIKMLSESLAGEASVKERFFREARSMAQLNDPHIVQVYMIGEDHGQPYFAMEFVEGESLSQRLRREHRLDPEVAARILLQVAQGLATAHDRGVIHRDIKPANLLINQRGIVKVADFGIALASQDHQKKLTGTGQFVGTPGYLSPEVCLGKPVDQRSDLFALGIVFFEMLTGRTPYKDESPLGMMLEVVQAEIPDVRAVNAAVDPRLSAILKRMVAKEPDERYADCHQLIADLLAFGVQGATPVPMPARPSDPALGTVMNSPTPAELRRPMPSLNAALAPPAAYQNEPSQPVLTAVPPSAPRKPSLLPWAAAVLGLVGSAAAASWYLGGLEQLGLPGPSRIAQADPAPVPATSAPSAAPAPAVPASAQPAAAAIGDGVGVGEADRGDPQYAAQESDVVAPGVRANAPEFEATPESTQIGARLAELRERRLEQREAALPLEAENGRETTPAALTARVEQLGARAEAVAERIEQRAERIEQRVARADPPPAPSPPVWRGPPRVLVISLGDPAVAGSATAAIEERLAERGLGLVDAALLSGVGGLREGREPDLPRLLGALSNRAEYVVVVRVEPIGQQLLTFYGEAMTQYSARLKVDSYDVRSRQRAGASVQAEVRFTHLNAEANTREALAPHLARIGASLDGPRGRG